MFKVLPFLKRNIGFYVPFIFFSSLLLQPATIEAQEAISAIQSFEKNLEPQPISINQTIKTENNDSSNNDPVSLRNNTFPDQRLSAVDNSRQRMVERLNKLSQKLDQILVSTFSDSQSIQEIEDVRSEARVSFTTGKIKDEALDSKIGINVRLVLPKTNERVKLFFESEDDELENSLPDEERSRNEFNATIRFILREGKQWKVNVDTGVRWGLPPDPFLRLRATRKFNFDFISYRIRQTLLYKTADGYGTTSEFRANYLTPTKDFLQFKAKAGYLKNQDYFDLRYQTTYLKPINQSSQVVVGFTAQGDDRVDATFYNYQVFLNYQKNIWRPWFFISASPSIFWRREKDYQRLPSFAIGAEILFNDDI